MTSTRRRFLKITSAALAAPALSRGALADAWPKDRPIRAIVPFSAGASIDIIVAEGLAQKLGQTIVIENRGGAGGTTGAKGVASSDPDGYTLLINSSNHSISPALYKNLGYDVANDFAGIALFGTVPNVLLAAPSKGWKTVHDLVEKGKKDELTFSSSGVGSASHWAAERFRVSAGIKTIHVPFRGGGEALTEVITGRIDFCTVGITAAMGFINDGKAIPLSVLAAKRSPSLPQLETSLEAGYKDSAFVFWNGLLAPAKTPRSIIERLHTETMAALETAEVRNKLGIQGVEPSPVTPAQFDAQIKREIDENLKVAEAAGVKQN
jgi:tripartite-type tricarboxylate transporter receptor subunit TctC